MEVLKSLLMDNWLILLARKIRLIALLLLIFSSCQVGEPREYKLSLAQINEKEIVVDFTKINPGPWDTLLLIAPYSTSEQIGLGYRDSQFLAQRALNDAVITSGFMENGDLNGFSAFPKVQVDFNQILGDSAFIKKIPRSAAVFRFIKQEEGTYLWVK